ncbi:MAG TPA: hypothetical protein DDX14_01355, partial [Cyanobacteria bacterium UBA9579]|nr:hypothetical protein [Cyanobacteria bacterium UBA9579]
MKYENLKPKEIAYIAVFGALWGSLEVTIGMFLHNMNIPFSGLILTLIGAFIALTCVRLINRRRAILYTAFIAAILKMLSFTTIKLGPMIGIITAASISQITILILNINLISYIISAGLTACAPFLQFLVGHSIIYSPKIFNIYQDFLNLLGHRNLDITTIIIIIVALHFVLGCIIGLCAWQFSTLLIKRINNY